MAKYKSIVDLHGTIGNLTFYTYRGKPVVRAKTSLNKEQVMNRPEFANSRGAMAEFGGASKVGKELRRGLGDNWRLFGEGASVNRLNGALLKVIKMGEGLKGQRPFKLHGNEHFLRGFELREAHRFGSRYKAPLGLHYNLLGDHLEISLGPFRPDEHLTKPHGSEFFRIRFLLVLLPDFYYHTDAKSYVPSVSIIQQTQELGTEWLPIQEGQLNFRYPVDLSGDFSPGNGKSLLTFVSIQFGALEGKDVIEMENGAAMALVDVK
jgi:hypothetical protein